MKYVIAGQSPYLYRPSREWWEDKHGVLAINKTITERAIQEYVGKRAFWFVWDTHDMHINPDMPCPADIDHTMYFRDTPEARERYDYLYKVRWFDESEVKIAQNSCTAAADLAYKQFGATEIYLCGVDFCSPTPGWTQEVFDRQVPYVNEFFKNFPIPVYKTVEHSPLQLPYRPVY